MMARDWPLNQVLAPDLGGEDKAMAQRLSGHFQDCKVFVVNPPEVYDQ